MANDREITQKKQKLGLNHDDIKMAVFCRNEKVQIIQRLVLCTTRFNE